MLAASRETTHRAPAGRERSGGEPRSLAALLRWYRKELSDAIPGRLHKHDLGEGGTPEWHASLRTWLTAHPGASDDDGHILAPLRYWLWRMESSGPDRAAFLMLLAAWDGDWRAAARVKGVQPPDAAHDFARASLRQLFRSMYATSHDPEGRVVLTPIEPHRPERGDCAERGCTNRTTRYRCAEHEKSQAQADAEAAG